MLPYVPESTSELLRATHIVLAAIEGVSLGEWQPDGDMLVSRGVQARFRVERALKGELDTLPGRVINVALRVFENRGPRVVAIPGIWSQCPLTPGAHYVIFSISPSKDAADLLAESAAFRVEPAGTALPEIESLLEIVTPEKSLPEVVAQAAFRRGEFTHLIARYAAWRLRELFFDDPAGFHAVLREAEHPAATAVFRRTVIIEAYDDLLMLDPAPAVFLARLIWGSLRVVASGPGKDLASRVLETYIPNLVGLEGGSQKKTAAAVFQTTEQSRREVVELLRSRPDLPGRDRVLAWLDS